MSGLCTKRKMVSGYSTAIDNHHEHCIDMACDQNNIMRDQDLIMCDQNQIMPDFCFHQVLQYSLGRRRRVFVSLLGRDSNRMSGNSTATDNDHDHGVDKS